jgi:predicted nucleotidyltransferase
MTTMSNAWQQLTPRRGALGRLTPGDRDVWAERLSFDRERADRHQSSDLTAITKAVRERAWAAGAEAVVLSGSTARGHRTRVSDLDYHVVGASSLRVDDLPEDIDLYVDEVDHFWAKLREGDDFAYWSVWYGCVLFDSGVMREAAEFVAERDAWPDPERKLRQTRGSLNFAGQIVESGDYGAALEQTRGALSLVARWVLLSKGVFPLARDELPAHWKGWAGQDLLATFVVRSGNVPPPTIFEPRSCAPKRSPVPPTRRAIKPRLEPSPLRRGSRSHFCHISSRIPLPKRTTFILSSRRSPADPWQHSRGFLTRPIPGVTWLRYCLQAKSRGGALV